MTHNVECYGFIIQHQEFGKIVFATDTNSFPYKIKGINHFMLEANYSNDTLEKNALNDVEMKSRHEQHLELQSTLEALKLNYTASLQNVVLLHLSQTNGNPKQFKSKIIKELCHNSVYIAKKGLYLSLEKTEF